MFDFTKQWEARVVINGRPVTEYHHTDGNVYLEGRKGSEYELEVINHSLERILVVPAVDGLSVMDGKTAGLDSDGYVINPRGTLRIPGWRLDNENVAKFVFGDTAKGYSAQSGQGSTNSGVIGFMVFRQQPSTFDVYNPFHVARNYSGNATSAEASSPWSTTCDMYSSSVGGSLSKGLESFGAQDAVYAAAEASPPRINESVSLRRLDVTAKCAANVAQPVQVTPELATGFGRKDQFNTVDVTFDKRDANNPDAIMVMYYDSLRGLEKRGIVVRKEATPQAFPRYSSSKGCTPPTGWRG